MPKKFGTPIVTVNNHTRGTSMGRKNRSLEAKHKKAKKMAVEYAIHSALDQSGFEYRMGEWKPLKSTIIITPKIKYSECNGDNYSEFKAEVAKDLITRVPTIRGKLQKLHQVYA